MNLETTLKNFFVAYGQEQASLGQHMSAKAELERKSRELYLALAKHYDQDEMPSSLVLNSPYGVILLTIDVHGKAIRKIEEVQSFSTYNPKKYDPYIAGLNLAQLSGLATLIFLSIREKTSIAYQWKEWGFTDISHETIQEFQRYFDQLTNTEMLQIVNSITSSIHKHEQE